MFNVGPWELMLILFILLLLFGGRRLPELARSIGRGMRAFRDEAYKLRREVEEEPDTDEATTSKTQKELESKEEKIKAEANVLKND